jgi:hypothetical protein
VKSTTAEYDPVRNIMHFDQGFPCKATDGHCFHPDLGSFVWEMPHINCTDEFEMLFVG